MTEDVATGSAAGPTAAYLIHHDRRSADQSFQVHQGQFVLAKLQAPVPRERVSRPALLDLCNGHRRKLTLVRAPAGWGKSTLLADWHASTDETRPFAWLALDQADNDPATFWTYVIEALRTQQAVSGDRSLATLQAPRVDVITDVLPELYAELDTLPHDVVLVLDDYHLVTNPEIDESLAFFVEHLPRPSRSSLASRSEPPLPLARLRARGDLVEIVAQELGFSDEEAGLLLNDLHGLGLDDRAVSAAARAHRGMAGRPLPGGADAAGPARPRRVHRRLRRRRPPHRRLPERRGAARPARRHQGVPPPDLRPRPLLRTPVRRRDRAGRLPPDPARAASRRTSSSFLSTPSATGTATTTCSVTCCAWSWS